MSIYSSKVNYNGFNAIGKFFWGKVIFFSIILKEYWGKSFIFNRNDNKNINTIAKCLICLGSILTGVCYWRILHLLDCRAVAIPSLSMNVMISVFLFSDTCKIPVLQPLFWYFIRRLFFSNFVVSQLMPLWLIWFVVRDFKVWLQLQSCGNFEITSFKAYDEVMSAIPLLAFVCLAKV